MRAGGACSRRSILSLLRLWQRRNEDLLLQDSQDSPPVRTPHNTPNANENQKKRRINMTSPAISGQKDNTSANGGKDSTSNEDSASTAGKPQEAAIGEEPTPPLTAWWRVFKLASLLMKQGC